MDSTFYPILVPIDFSDQSMIALEQAERIGVLTKGELVLLSFNENYGILRKLFVEDDESYVDVKLKLQARLDSLVSEVISRAGIKVNGMVTMGRVHQKIIEVAELVSAKLIVMGTSGAPLGLSEKVIGSNAMRVISKSSCPVITIKGSEHFNGCRTIILPLDLEKETKQKVRHVLTLACLWSAIVKIVSVVERDDFSTLSRLKANLHQVQNYLSGRGVKSTIDLINFNGRSLSNAILDYSNLHQADLIMIMTQQENNFKQRLIGSAAQSIIYNSDVPVMSIHPEVKITEEYSFP